MQSTEAWTSSRRLAKPYQRKLVSIRQITQRMSVNDRKYEVVIVDGWTVVVLKDDRHKVGDFVIYFEIDSFIPASDPRIWDLQSGFSDFNGTRGYHVKSRRILNKVSQGKVFRISAFPEITSILDGLKRLYGHEEALERAMEMRFEDELGVIKWSKDPEGNGHYIASTPGFFPLPGCPRIQSGPERFDTRNLDVMYQITEKLDGFPMVAYHVRNDSPWIRGLVDLPEGSKALTKTGRFALVDREGELDPNNGGPYWEVAEAMDLVSKVPQIGKNIAISGELCNSSMFGNNGYAEGEHRFYVFGMYDIDKQRRFGLKEVESICHRLGLPHVPVLGYKTMRQLASSMEDLLLKAEGIGFRGQIREGFMLKTTQGDGAWKVVSNAWLLEKGY